MKNIAVVGLGFIYNKHSEAIYSLGNLICAGCDIDSTKQDKLPNGVPFETDYRELLKYNPELVIILTPNYLHKEMACFFANVGIPVLVEKPAGLSSNEILEMAKTKSPIYTVMQLRYHDEFLKWKENISDKNRKVEMKILVRRDQWYFDGWKGNEKESGGLLFNIGVHYFDILTQLFGDILLSVGTDLLTDKRARGTISFLKADVDWELSLDAPMDNQKRILTIDGERVNLSQNFENLHTAVYKELFSGNGLKVSEALPVIKLIESLKDGYVL